MGRVYKYFYYTKVISRKHTCAIIWDASQASCFFKKTFIFTWKNKWQTNYGCSDLGITRYFLKMNQVSLSLEGKPLTEFLASCVGLSLLMVMFSARDAWGTHLVWCQQTSPLTTTRALVVAGQASQFLLGLQDIPQQNHQEASNKTIYYSQVLEGTWYTWGPHSKGHG